MILDRINDVIRMLEQVERQHTPSEYSNGEHESLARSYLRMALRELKAARREAQADGTPE